MPSPPDAPRASSTAGFFTLVLGLTTLVQAPLVLAQRGVLGVDPEPLWGLAMLGPLMPLTVALVCARRDGGGAKNLLRRAIIAVPGPWWAAALVVFPLLSLLGTVAYRALGGVDATWPYPPVTGLHVASLVMIPLLEEVGWRGYALPRLLQRHSPLVATLLLGAGWAAWHTFMFLAVTTSVLTFCIAVANILAGAFVFTWFFVRTRGSLGIAIALHVGTHLNNPAHALPNAAPLGVYTVAIAAAALLLWALSPPRPAASP